MVLECLEAGAPVVFYDGFKSNPVGQLVLEQFFCDTMVRAVYKC
jgi:hypothetical protein